MIKIQKSVGQVEGNPIVHHINIGLQFENTGAIITYLFYSSYKPGYSPDRAMGNLTREWYLHSSQRSEDDITVHLMSSRTYRVSFQDQFELNRSFFSRIDHAHLSC